MGIGIREARKNLPTLVKRAAQDDEDIQLGSRGADEVTLVSTGKYDRLLRELDRVRDELARLSARLEATAAGAGQRAAQEQPFAGIQRALEEGRLSLQPDDGPRMRTYIPDYSGISTVGREERIRFGANTPEPEYRRTGPRA